MSETLKRRPWWVAAMVGGGAAGATLVAGIGPRGESHVAAAAMAPAHDEVTAEQLRGLTTTISNLQARLDQTITQVSELNGRLSRIEGRLEKR